MKKFTLFKTFTLAALMMSLATSGWGQIAAWDFTNVGATSLPTFAATTFSSNLVSTSGANNITRGPGAAWSNAANSFRTVGFLNDGISTANTDYFQITLTAQSGFTLSLSTIDARFAGTSTFAASPGVSNQFAYSLDGTTFTLIGSPSITIGTPATLPQINLAAISALQNVPAGTTVTIRYYASGQTTTGGWGFNSPSAGVNGLALGGTLTAVAVTPTLSVTPTSLSGFTYAEGSGPSVAQSFSVSGTNLNGTDVTITAPANYEVSTASAGTYGATVTLTAFTGSATNLWVRLAAVLGVNTYTGNVSIAGGGATTVSVAVSGSVTAAITEPTNHVTDFAASSTITATSIALTWNDAVPAASGYLIIGTTGACSGIANPVDGTAQANAALIQNVAAGVQTHTFAGLTPNTLYCFRIFPYNGSGTDINYKTDGVVPEASATTLSITTYSWIGAEGASWQVAANWNPARTTPDPTDILLFDAGVARTITAVPTQTIAQMQVTNNTAITLQAAAANNTLTIAGGTGTDLLVEAGSQLNISGTNALQVSLLTGATGTVSGSMTFTNAAHRLLAVAANAITFHSGASFTAGTGFGGNAFGSTAAHNGTIVFSSGSTYTQIDGANPFGPSAVNAAVFQTGSLFRFMATGNPAFSGRTYANFEYDLLGGEPSTTGTAAVRIDNFTVTRGTFNFNMTGTLGHAIRGDITVAPGATLNFNPASAGTVNLNGTTLQTISGGGTITANTFSTLATSNPVGVRLGQAAQFHNLTISSGIFEVAAAGQARINGTLTNSAGNAGLVLRSGASMIHNNAGVEATMERFFADFARWRLVSSPVDNQAIDLPWRPTTPNHGYDFYDWREQTATWRNQKVPGNNITHFASGVGYLVSFQGADLTQSFAGALNNGIITVPVTRLHHGAHRGANLLGNPYPSSIDWHLAVRTLFVDEFAYIYDPLFGTGGGYVPVNGTNPGALIAPNQGFFVIKAVDGTADFTFTNAMRVHGGVFRSAPADPVISITLQQGAFYDRAQIVQLQDATTARERSDALKFFSYNPMMPQVFSMSSDALQLAVNSTGPITEDASFTIGVLTPVAGTYTLQIDGLQEMLAGRPAFLLDKVTGTSHNLREQSRISFHAVQSNTAVERFVLNFVQPTGVGNKLPEDATVVYFANGMLHIQFAAEERNRQLQVIDLSGRVVFIKSLHGMGNMVSVPLQIDNGAYIVRITGEASAVNRRILVR